MKPIFYASFGIWFPDYININNKYYDNTTQAFYHCPFNVNHLSPVEDGVYEYGRRIDNIAIDHISRLVYYTGRMYYTELDDNFIAAVTFEGHYNFLLVTTRGSSISNIALDSKAG